MAAVSKELLVLERLQCQLRAAGMISDKYISLGFAIEKMLRSL